MITKTTALALQSAVRKQFLAVTRYSEQMSDGQQSFCQILTRESIKRHSKSSIRTDTTNMAAFWDPQKRGTAFPC